MPNEYKYVRAIYGLTLNISMLIMKMLSKFKIREYTTVRVSDQAGAVALLDGSHGDHGGADKLGLY